MTRQTTDRGHALELLRRAVDDPEIDFRDGQWQAIEALVNRRARLLVVQRTGWGKSAVYFIATRILRDRGQGPTLIVSPLLALMRNQQEAAARLGLLAATINSANRSDWSRQSQLILDNRADALLISPERLANDEFVAEVLLQDGGLASGVQEAGGGRGVQRVWLPGPPPGGPARGDRPNPVSLG